MLNNDPNPNPLMTDPNSAAQVAQQQAQQGPGQPPMEQPAQPQDPQQQQENYLDYALSQANLAKSLKTKQDDEGNLILEKMGTAVYEGYMRDEASREPWMEKNRKWLELALLVSENKTWPWPRAANIKYPLVATAAMQFSARAYPALVPSDGSIVKARVAPNDLTGQLAAAAGRVAKHMSYQVMEIIPKWEENMDKLLMTMAISGIAFKKTYHDKGLGVHKSHLVYPENFCINYWAKDVESAYRKTELLYYNCNEIKEKQLNDEEFLDVELPEPSNSGNENDNPKKPISSDNEPPTPDKSTPHVFLAVHTYWDLDKDGYEEPYIITIHRDTKKVVRIIARWDSDGIIKNAKGKTARIVPVEYFTAFPFIPNPDGSIYACGFGMLLGSLNNATNTIINQLIDAGTMSNLQSGFIGRNLRIKEGQLQLRPNEWKVVNASGEDLQKSIYPLPAKEPSDVLMSLLQMLITSGNQLASIAEIFVGKMPGQNTPASTTQETIQQGMAVFTAVYKRVYRSLAEEFAKLFRLNRITPNIVQEETLIAGIPIQDSDYDSTQKLIIPGGDPSGDSATTKLQKLQIVGQLIQMGTINAAVYTQRVLEANDIPNPQELIAQPQPPAPDPKAATEQLKQQGMQQKFQLEGQAKQQDMQNKQQSAHIDQAAKIADVQAKEHLLQLQVAQKAMMANQEQQNTAIMNNHDKLSKQLDLVFKVLQGHQKVQQGVMESNLQDAQAQKEMARADDLHDQKMDLQAKAAAAAQQNSGE